MCFTILYYTTMELTFIVFILRAITSLSEQKANMSSMGDEDDKYSVTNQQMKKSEKGVASTIGKPSKLTSENLANRQERFKETERQLETVCNNEGVEYIPPSPGESNNLTRSRRRKLKKNVSN